MKIGCLLFFVVIGLSANGQSAKTGSGTAPQSAVSQNASTQDNAQDDAVGQANNAAPATPKFTPRSVHYDTLTQEPDDLRQEIDWDSVAASKIPADPVFNHDFFSPVVAPFNRTTDWMSQTARLKFGATYTFVSQYATQTPDHVRHAETDGRADVTAAWKVYEHGSTAGSISMVVRSQVNIGISQQYNLSNGLGSGLTLNCLQGGGAEQPITLNLLYWRQDILHKRLSFYIGKIHPNEFISLSMFNDDERTQFLNGASDGNASFASDGAYAGGAAVEWQATPRLYIHLLTVDTEGTPQGNLETMVDRKYMQSVEAGWFSGEPGKQFRDYRFNLWRDDTRSLGSGAGGGIGFEHELRNGWAPFGRLGFATHGGSSIRQVEELGLAQMKPFGRRGDMFGIALVHSEPNTLAHHHEGLIESFYRLRLTQSVDLGPDIEVAIHPTYASKTYTPVLLGLRMRIIL